MDILIVDDDFGSRSGMALTLAASYPTASIYQAASVRVAIAALVDNPSMTLILLDLNVDDSSGLDTLRALKTWCESNDCNPRLVVVSAASDYDDDIVANAFDECATGFIAKGISEAAFRSAIELTLAGQIVVSERYRKRQSAALPAGAPSIAVSLTARENEVGRLVVQGCSYKQIARKLGTPDRPMSDGTVRVHVQRVAWKLRTAFVGLSESLPAKAVVVTAYTLKLVAFESADDVHAPH